MSQTTLETWLSLKTVASRWVLLCVLTLTVSAAEPLKNGDFEQSSGWRTMDNHHPDRVTLDTTTAAHGRTSLRFDGRDGDFFLDSWAQDFSPVPNVTYALRFAVRRTTTVGSVALIPYRTDADNRVKSLGRFGQSATCGVDCWEYFTGSFTWPETARGPRLGLYATDTGGIVWFDDIRMRRIRSNVDPFALHVKQFDTPPRIDGQLDEWEGTDAAAEFMLIGPEAIHAIQSRFSTTVRLAYDDDFLYVAAECGEPAHHTRHATYRGRDGDIWKDDVLEVFLAPRSGSREYYHIVINPLGALYDSHKKPEAANAGNPAWDSGTKVETSTDEDRWRAEIAIPLATLNGMSVARGETFAVNFARSTPGLGVSAGRNSSWARLVPGQGFHTPDAFQAVFCVKGDAAGSKTVSFYQQHRVAGLLPNPDFSVSDDRESLVFWQPLDAALVQPLQTGYYTAGSEFNVSLRTLIDDNVKVTLTYRNADNETMHVTTTFDTRAGAVAVGRLTLGENAATLDRVAVACESGQHPLHVQVSGARMRNYKQWQHELTEFFINDNPDVIPKDTAATFALYPEAGIVPGVLLPFPFNSIQNIKPTPPGPQGFLVPDRNWRLVVDLPDDIGVASVGLINRGFIKPGTPSPQTSPHGESYRRYVIPYLRLSRVGQLRLYLTASTPSGPRKSAYYHLAWDGGQQVEETFAIRVYDPIRIEPPRRFVAATYASFHHHPNDQRGDILFERDALNILKGYHGLGLNTFGVSHIMSRGPVDRPRMDRFIGQLHAAGLTPFLNTGGTSRFSEASQADGGLAVTRDGPVKKGLCPSYRGKGYTALIEAWGDAVRHGIYWIDNDWEDWNYNEKTICFCDRCKAAFEAWLAKEQADLPYRDPEEFERSPGSFPDLHQAWFDFKNDQFIAWHADIRRAMTEKMQALDVDRPGFPKLTITTSMTFDWKRMTETVVDYVSPMLYAYHGYKAEPAVEYTGRQFLRWRQDADVDRSRYLVTIAPAERDGRLVMPDKAMMEQVLEVAGSGAAGFKIWNNGVMNGGKYYWMARALRMIAPVEDILLDGQIAQLTCDPPTARARVFTAEQGTVLFVAEYGLTKTTVRVPLILANAGDAYDLDSREKMTSLHAGENTLSVPLDDVRVGLVFVGDEAQCRAVGLSE